MPSLCQELYACEGCNGMESCELYYAEKGFQLLSDRYEEDWKEREDAKRAVQ